MQIKIPVRHHSTPIRMYKIKKDLLHQVWARMETMRTPNPAGKIIKRYNLFGKQVSSF